MSLTPEILELLQQHRQRFLSFLTPRVGSQEAAEEILQSALVKGWERGSTLREEESAVAWFYRLLRNALIDQRRGMKRGARALSQFAEEQELSSADARDLEQTVCACVHALSTTLKPDYAQVLKRVDMEDTGLTEYAQEAGITYNNAKVRLHRARQALAARIEQTCGAQCCRKGCADCPCEPL